MIFYNFTKYFTLEEFFITFKNYFYYTNNYYIEIEKLKQENKCFIYEYNMQLNISLT